MDLYQIVKELGSGSFGKVFKARRKDEKSQYVAIKQIKMTSLCQKQKDGALNQIRLLASIQSPNVIAYHTAFFDNSTSNLCIVMEYADGGDLMGLIQKKKECGKKIHENFIWKVAFDLLRALKILHTNKILHRDIKPGNIFFVSGVAKLGDLNISKVMQGNFASTQAGTPYYTSPEIWNGQFYDGKCDIWSLGCLLYEMASFKPPFTANNFPQLKKKVNQGYFDPIPSIYSKRLSDIIKSCLKVNMYERPNSNQLLNDSVFQYMKTTQQGSVNLLNTIRCPKILSLIQQKLPQFKSHDKNSKNDNQKGSFLYKPKTEMTNLILSDRQRQYSGIQVSKRQSYKQNDNQKKKSLKRQQIIYPQSRGVIHRIQSPQPYRNKLDEPVRMKSPTLYRRIM